MSNLRNSLGLDAEVQATLGGLRRGLQRTVEAHLFRHSEAGLEGALDLRVLRPSDTRVQIMVNLNLNYMQVMQVFF